MKRKTIQAVRDGLTFDDASAIEGTDVATLPDAARLEAAEIEFKRCMVGTVIAAAKHDWRAAAWLLERRFPIEFAQPERRQGFGAKVQDQVSPIIEHLKGAARKP